MIDKLIKISGKEYDKEIIEYGLAAMMNGAISIIIILFLAIIDGSLPQSIIYLLSNLLIYTQVGGYHAKTRLGCVLLTIINWKVAISFFYMWINTPIILWVMACAIFVTSIWICAPVLHPNKARFGEKTKLEQKVKAVIRVLLGYIVLIIFWNIHKQEYAGILMMSISEIVIFMLIGKGVYAGYEEQEAS